MKDKINNFKNKKYLCLFILVMMLNTILAVTLIRVSFGQIKKDDFSLQQPIKVEVMDQKDSPLRVVVVSVDNSPLSYQNILFSLQNVSNKPIKAYTVLGKGKKRSGKIITSFFVAKRFLVGESVVDNLDVERSNITEGETILLSVDYVEFEDGSFWGNDSAKKSEEIAGRREGTKAAIKRLKELMVNRNPENTNDIVNFLKQDMQKIVIDVPDTNQSDEWKKAFRLAYKFVIFLLQGSEEQKIENITQKLNEMEEIANQGGK